MKKTASCKKGTELPGQSSLLIGQKKYFSAQSAGRNSTTSGTGSVRISSQGLFRSSSKLSPENIASSRLVAPGFPRMDRDRPLRVALYSVVKPIPDYIIMILCNIHFISTGTTDSKKCSVICTKQLALPSYLLLPLDSFNGKIMIS